MKTEAEQKARRLTFIHLTTMAIDTLNLSAIFTFIFVEAIRPLFESLLKFFMFPVAPIAGFIFSVLAFLDAYDHPQDQSLWLRFGVEASTAVAVFVAVLIGLGVIAIDILGGLMAPVIFTAALGTKAIFNAGLALHYAYQSIWGHDQSPAIKKAYREKAITAAVGALVLGLATIAVGVVMLAGKTACAFIGIAAGLIGAGFAGYKIAEKIAEERKSPSRYKKLDAENAEDLKNYDNTRGAKKEPNSSCIVLSSHCVNTPAVTEPKQVAVRHRERVPTPTPNFLENYSMRWRRASYDPAAQSMRLSYSYGSDSTSGSSSESGRDESGEFRSVTNLSK